MKRTSTHITRAPSPPKDAPRHSGSSSSTAAAPPPAPVEQLRFRERDGSCSAYTRLYAQGVDQLVHKDHVYQQFGLHKSPPAARNKPLVSATATTTAQLGWAGSANGGGYRAVPTSLHHRPITRSSGATVAALAPRHHRAATGGGSFAASTPTKRSATGSTYRTKTTPTAASSRTKVIKPQRRQSAIATQLLNKTLKIGPALIHSVSSAAVLPSSQAMQRRPSVATMGALSSDSQHQLLHRRPSFNASARLAAKHSNHQAPSPTRLSETLGPPPPAVLVPVSRRTSSPLVDDGSMRKRPSVSPIRSGHGQPSHDSGSGNSSDGTGGAMPQRRDSKMDRLVEQITVLKNSLGLSDEDLQWKVESTKGNAYEAADRHLCEAEEHYDRVLYEIQMLSETPCDESSAALVRRMRELSKQNHLVAELKPTLVGCQGDLIQRKKELLDARIACELEVAKGGGDSSANADDALVAAQQRVDDAQQRILQTQTQLKDEMTKLNELLVTLGQETETLAAACAKFQFLSSDAADASTAFLTVLRCIPECSGDKLVALCEQGVQTAQRFTGSKAKEIARKEAESEKLLREIEVWKTRKEQSKEFAVETAARERQWKLAQHDANAASLRLLRSLVPLDIQQITVDTLLERVRELSGGSVFFTYDLALYIKQNRLLHWLVTHESDISRDNFLAVESAPYFLNFTSYDIHELRAVCAILPESFDFDKDGKKTEWKRQFMDHVRLLVKQQSGETIKAGWDPTKGTRADVPLKPLSDRQLLNTVYRYPTNDEIQTRIDKLELQRQRLAHKKDKKFTLETVEIPTAKSEYLATAEDARSDELQQQFGKATLIGLRDDAKQALHKLTKTRDALASEIDHAERQWSTQTPSYEQLLEEAAKIRALDVETRAARIRGPFPQDVELTPRARAAFKKLSVEEEAQARRLELSQAIADRDKGLVGETATASPSVDPATVAVVPLVESVVVAEPESPRESSSEYPTEMSSSVLVDSDAAADGAATMEETTGFRRVKSVRVASEVLRFLQNDFCSQRRTKSNTTLPAAEIFGSSATASSAASAQDPPAAAPPFQRRRPSRSDAAERTAGAEDRTRGSTTAAEPAVAKPKSKALLALLEKQAQTSTSTIAAPVTSTTSSKPTAAKPDFLSELKRKASGAADMKANDADSCDPRLQRPGMTKASGQMDLFSEIKSRTVTRSSGNDGSSTNDAPAKDPPKKMGFLEELVLRARRSASISPEEPSAPAAPASSVPTATSRSFLDELKTKAQRNASVSGSE
jgi:hypothetical protein